MPGLGDGFQFSVPADRQLRRLKAFVVNSEFNGIHAVEYSSSRYGPWLKLTNFLGTVGDAFITDPATVNLGRFYRVRLE